VRNIRKAKQSNDLEKPKKPVVLDVLWVKASDSDKRFSGLCKTLSEILGGKK